MKPELISACGMNCYICKAYLREKNKCPGCRFVGKDYKSKTIVRCKIKNCNNLKKNNWKFCSNKCKEFPCNRLVQLDKRYRTKYDMSMIDNLKVINEKGINKFLNEQEKKYIKGNKVLCVHDKEMYLQS
jgi:hypothetical protein